MVQLMMFSSPSTKSARLRALPPSDRSRAFNSSQMLCKASMPSATPPLSAPSLRMAQATASSLRFCMTEPTMTSLRLERLSSCGFSPSQSFHRSTHARQDPKRMDNGTLTFSLTPGTATWEGAGDEGAWLGDSTSENTSGPRTSLCDLSSNCKILIAKFLYSSLCIIFFITRTFANV